jgi:hypothetical protein
MQWTTHSLWKRLVSNQTLKLKCDDILVFKVCCLHMGSQLVPLYSPERIALMQQLAELGRPAGNCALLTGTWYADTRYELTFSAPNPAATTASTDLGWWMAPVSYAAPAASAAGRGVVAFCRPRFEP